MTETSEQPLGPGWHSCRCPDNAPPAPHGIHPSPGRPSVSVGSGPGWGAPRAQHPGALADGCMTALCACVCMCACACKPVGCTTWCVCKLGEVCRLVGCKWSGRVQLLMGCRLGCWGELDQCLPQGTPLPACAASHPHPWPTPKPGSIAPWEIPMTGYFFKRGLTPKALMPVLGLA